MTWKSCCNLELLMLIFLISFNIMNQVNCEKIKIGVLMPHQIMTTLSLFNGALDSAAKKAISDPQFLQVTNITEVEFIHLNSKQSRF